MVEIQVENWMHRMKRVLACCSPLRVARTNVTFDFFGLRLEFRDQNSENQVFV